MLLPQAREQQLTPDTSMQTACRLQSQPDDETTSARDKQS